MPNTVYCNNCQYSIDVPETSGDHVRCPMCGMVIVSTEPVVDAEEVFPDSNITSTNAVIEIDDAAVIEADDIIDDVADASADAAEPDSPMGFLKSLEPAVPEGRRRCPHCRELILQNAIKCRHCLTLLDSKEVQRPPMSALMRDLTIAERLMMQSYRAGMRRLMAFSALMTILGIGYTLYYASLPGTTVDGEARFHFFGGFALGWFGCAYYCGKYEIDGAYVVGGLCVFDMLWTIATLNPLGVLVCGPMLWVVIRTVGHGRALRRRGLDLRLPW